MNKYLKIISYILLTVFLISFSACSKSTNLIEGEWKAQTGAMKNEIVKFDNDKVTVNGKEYDYKLKSNIKLNKMENHILLFFQIKIKI